MKLLCAFAAVFLLAVSPTSADSSDDVGKAQLAAKSWLALTDAAKYGTSWDEAASLFKAAVTRANWESTIQGVRVPLGAVQARKVKSATFTRTLPGAPDGQYVVIQFETRFEHKASAVETVTPMLDKDGAWRVSGYFIR